MVLFISRQDDSCHSLYQSLEGWLNRPCQQGLTHFIDAIHDRINKRKLSYQFTDVRVCSSLLYEPFWIVDLPVGNLILILKLKEHVWVITQEAYTSI